MYIKNKRGQSTVEYILLVTAVIAVMIVFLTGKGGGGLGNQLNTALSQAANDMNSAADVLYSSHGASNGEATSPTPPYWVNVAGPSS
jgi:Flp pilus assembly pilin Flp